MAEKCRYCDVLLNLLGVLEGVDDLGTYLAETWTCPQCGYRLEKNPIYVDAPDDDPPRQWQVVD